MKLLGRIGWRRGAPLLAALAALAFGVVHLSVSHDPEIALVIGEPSEDMRRRSSAVIDPADPNEIWFNIPKSDARLRFFDAEYGFVTPPARFFAVFYSYGVVRSVRMSPQIEPLLLDDALKIVLDLQEQWRKAGWTPIRTKDFPPFTGTPEWRANLTACKPNGTYWNAGERFQMLLSMACFQDDRHPDQERYLITLSLAKPWVEP